VTVKGFKKWYTSIAMDGTVDYTLWNGSEEDEKVRSEVRKMKGLPVKKEDKH